MGGPGARATRDHARFADKTRTQPVVPRRKPVPLRPRQAVRGIPSFDVQGVLRVKTVWESLCHTPVSLLDLGDGFYYDPRCICACGKTIDERYMHRVIAKGQPPPRWCWTCKERQHLTYTAARTIVRAFRRHASRRRLHGGVSSRLSAQASIYAPSPPAPITLPAGDTCPVVEIECEVKEKSHMTRHEQEEEAERAQQLQEKVEAEPAVRPAEAPGDTELGDTALGDLLLTVPADKADETAAGDDTQFVPAGTPPPRDDSCTAEPTPTAGGATAGALGQMTSGEKTRRPEVEA